MPTSDRDNDNNTDILEMLLTGGDPQKSSTGFKLFINILDGIQKSINEVKVELRDARTEFHSVNDENRQRTGELAMRVQCLEQKDKVDDRRFEEWRVTSAKEIENIKSAQSSRSTDARWWVTLLIAVGSALLAFFKH